MKKIIVSTIAIFGLLILSAMMYSCKKEEVLGPETKEPKSKLEYYFKCKMDDDWYQVQTDELNTYSSYGTGDIGWYYFTNFSLLGGGQTGISFFDKDLWLDANDVFSMQGNTYSLDVSDSSQAITAYITWVESGLNAATQDGTCTITSVEYRKEGSHPYFVINGTFEGTAIDINGATIQITEGEFNISAFFTGLFVIQISRRIERYCRLSSIF